MSMACWSGSWLQAAGTLSLRTIFATRGSLTDPCDSSQQLVAEIARVAENRKAARLLLVYQAVSLARQTSE
jgi:hypothetical protein